MKQKRFKKLLMSKGCSRNDVNEIVKETIHSGKTYAETYATINGVLNINLSCAADAFKNAIETLSKMAQACAKAISAFIETFSAEMRKEDAENALAHPTEKGGVEE